MKQTLLQISDDMRALDDLLFEVGGDVSDPRVGEAIEQWIKELDANLEPKVDNYAALITELLSRAKARSEEADRLASRARIDSNAAAFLKQRLKLVLEERGVKKLETHRYQVSVAGNGGKQPLDLHGEVPPEFCATRIEPDIALIRATLEEGTALPFAILQPRGTHLSIR